jgi:DNA-binding MarR family transcriptional regulator
MSAPDETAELLIHLARAARAEDGAAVLTPAQWTALRYLARANDASRTPSGFASFHATTRGTATQTLKTLETRGLIARAMARRDGRSVCYDLTDDGKAMLARDPLRDLSGAIAALPAPLRAALAQALPLLVSDLAARRAAPQFGTCRDCRHFEDTPASAYCACMAEGLAAAALDRLCINFGMR